MQTGLTACSKASLCLLDHYFRLSRFFKPDQLAGSFAGSWSGLLLLTNAIRYHLLEPGLIGFRQRVIHGDFVMVFKLPDPAAGPVPFPFRADLYEPAQGQVALQLALDGGDGAAAARSDLALGDLGHCRAFRRFYGCGSRPRVSI